MTGIVPPSQAEEGDMADEDVDDIEVVRQVYDAMAARDVERIVSLIDPACTITQEQATEAGIDG